MFTTRTRRLTAGLALALGLGLAPAAGPTVAGALPGGYSTPLPQLGIELDDADEADGAVEGRVVLSSPLAQALSADVQVLFPDAQPDDVLGCPGWDFGHCVYRFSVAVPAGAIAVPFEIALNDHTDEDAEVIGARVQDPTPAGRVRVGRPAYATVYDGDGLEIGLADDAPEAPEGDPGSDGTLDLVVEANQAVPHPVTFRVRTAAVGGYNGATPSVDHAPVDVVVELPAGETELTVPVPLVGDQLDEEPYELVFGHVQEPSHGAIAVGGGTAVARILDDDGPVVTWERPGGYQSPSRSARSAALTA